jgi:hypothetical protein
MKKQILSEEFKRMQKLAGMIKEGQSFTPEDNVNFKFKNKPANPKSMLTDTKSGEKFTKEEYWKNDIIGTDPSNIFPNYGSEASDGTWTLTFDEGEFSGFVEGEDFILKLKSMQESAGVLKENESSDLTNKEKIYLESKLEEFLNKSLFSSKIMDRDEGEFEPSLEEQAIQFIIKSLQDRISYYQ